MAVFCRRCARPVDASDRYCSSCGTELIPADPPDQEPIHPSRPRWLLPAVLGGLLLAGLGVTLAIGATRSTTPKRRVAFVVTTTTTPSTTAPPMTTTTAPPTTTTTIAATTTTVQTRAVRAPASVPPVVAECSHQLTYAVDGTAGPLFCSSGALNVLASHFYAGLAPLVMAVGPNSSPDQVEQAMCSDVTAGHSTNPEEEDSYALAKAYYGWHFAIDLSNFVVNGCTR